MTEPSWLETILARLDVTGPTGQEAREYLRARRVRVRLRPQSTGARWTLLGNILLNPVYATARDDAYALSLIVHEVHHLKQGMVKALSVQGELEAWQVQFAYLKSLTGRYSPHARHEAVISELMSLSLDDRSHLMRARGLMQQFAGKKYRIDLYPLSPLPGEIRYWWTRWRASGA